MRHLYSLIGIITLTLFLCSCSDSEGENLTTDTNIEIIEEPFIDDVNAEETAADTSSTGVYQETDTEEEISLEQTLKIDNATNAKQEEEKMSFCDCVKKNKKLSDIMMTDETSDTDFDKAMEELEGMKTGECKIMFPSQNNLEDQKAHQQMVKNCLEN